MVAIIIRMDVGCLLLLALPALGRQKGEGGKGIFAGEYGVDSDAMIR